MESPTIRSTTSLKARQVDEAAALARILHVHSSTRAQARASGDRQCSARRPMRAWATVAVTGSRRDTRPTCASGKAIIANGLLKAALVHHRPGRKASRAARKYPGFRKWRLLPTGRAVLTGKAPGGRVRTKWNFRTPGPSPSRIARLPLSARRSRRSFTRKPAMRATSTHDSGSLERPIPAEA